ncbi:MAG: enoyl-CoA hydratase/isomerase family protein, partial [bacterium]
MSYEMLLVEIVDRIATITINRPDKLNALNATLMGEIGVCVAALHADPSVGAIILTGAGRAFVAGADIAAIATQDAAALADTSRIGQQVFRSIERGPKPVIAAINGFAFGGGCELALACHIRIVSQSAKLGVPEVKLGLIPGYGGTQRLARMIGRGRA